MTTGGKTGAGHGGQTAAQVATAVTAEATARTAAIAAADDAFPFLETIDARLIPSAAVIAANTLVAFRLRSHPTVTATLTQVSIYIGTANGNVDVGLYASDGTTLTEVASTGSTATAGTNAVQTIPLASSVLPVLGQDYYALLISDSATLTLGRYVGVPGINLIDKVAVTKAVTYATDSGLPASATLASLTTGIGNTTWIRFRP